jgi:acetate kinase
MTAIAALNSGSSSIKFALYTLDEAQEPQLSARGKLERIGEAPALRVVDGQGAPLMAREWPDGAGLTHADLLGQLFEWAQSHLDQRQLIGLGHRVVHGGGRFIDPCLVDAPVLAALDDLCPLAPLHQPHNLAAIHALADIAPHLPQVACFDTGFHHTLPAIATRFALPRAWHDKGLRRYGFHGLSYAYIARQLAMVDPTLAQGRVIVAHLGSGASLCAMQGGQSVDTSMGFTALDGLMMGTRCGSLDPGVVLHLQQQEGLSAAEVEHMFYHDSGLLGVSGLSSDMRTLEASPAPEAAEAIDLFCWRVAREMGALVTSLGGLDGIIFTAGIGENSAATRARIIARLGWLGARLDEAANDAHAPIISASDSALTLRIIPTDEEKMIALQTLSVLKGQHP